jgi:hypothetical protein
MVKHTSLQRVHVLHRKISVPPCEGKVRVRVIRVRVRV